MNDRLVITRRHLPHWIIRGAIYFVTFCARDTSFDPDEQRIVLQHIIDGNGNFYDCFAAIVMPNHVHLLLRPIHHYTLSRVLHGIKGVSSHKINIHRGTKGRIWQNESYDRIVRNNREFYIKLRYMFRNPVKKGLTTNPSQYVGWYCNEETLRRSGIHG